MKSYFQKAGFCVSLVMIFLPYAVEAQTQILNTNGSTHTVYATGSSQIFYVPNDPTITKIEFTARGGSGGGAEFTGIRGGSSAYGATGARVTARFSVGNGPDDIRPGSYLYFIVGEQGASGSRYAFAFSGSESGGGGGGSAVLDFRSGVGYTLRLVAGGGGGAFARYQFSFSEDPVSIRRDGQGGRTTENAGWGLGGGRGRGGTNGFGGEGSSYAGGGGAYLGYGGGVRCPENTSIIAGEGGRGYPYSGYGGDDDNCGTYGWNDGGWGFGGGGAGTYSDNAGGGGGGGGYSGGGAGGYRSRGGAGGSFVSDTHVDTPNKYPGFITSNPDDGYISYRVFKNRTPVARCRPTTIYLNSSGTATLEASMVNNGSYDPDGESLTYDLSQTDFDCSDIGANSVTLTVTDGSGSSSTCQATVTVLETTAPTAECQDITVQLDAAGNASISAQDINGGSSDNCGIAGIAIDKTDFGCDDLGANTVTLTATDDSENSATCEATVTVLDVTEPTAACQDITVHLGPDGKASISAADVDSGSADNCGIAGMALDQTDFDCTDIGTNTVILTVTDGSDNPNTCEATVTVLDVTEPTAVCQDITVQLDTDGNATISAGDVDGGSFDNCGIAAIAIDKTEFSCSDPQTNTVTLTVTDDSGNTSTCTATVTVEDNVAPTALCQNITVQLDANGNASINPTDVDNGSSDACGIASRSLDTSIFDCSDVGANTVTLTVTDVNGNSSTCTATVTVEDNVAPTALCQNITVQLDASGNASITAADVDNGSSDACGIAGRSLDVSSFDCSDAGANTVTLTVTDVNGNGSTCTATVTVEDNVAPTVLCQDVTVQLDAGGNASITPADVDNGSSDACGIASRSLDISSFDCSDAGLNTVTLTVTDVNGNSSTCTATVTVEDNVAPTALCQNITLQLDANGNTSITPADVDNGSSDACGIASRSLDVSSFDCSDVGANTVTLTVTDGNGNSSTCTATVTVEDNVAPTALCQNITVQLDASGNASITAADVDNGSNDACGIADKSLDVSSFGCSDAGVNTVTLMVTDVNGNSSTCTATVTVEDNVAPTALCQDVTVQLDASGNASITPADVDNGSSDACGIASRSLDVSNFDCSDVGANTVTLTVTDIFGNDSQCTAEVTVVDNLAPVVSCEPATVLLGANGLGVLSMADVTFTSVDNCSISTTLLGRTSFDCNDVGEQMVEIAATDASGNIGKCLMEVTVVDNVAPTVTCQNLTVQLDAFGEASVTAAAIDNGSVDACGISSRSLDVTTFDCSDIGANTVNLTVTDNHGNSSTCTATVTVEDNVAPTALCQDLTVQLDANGTASISASDVDNGSADACGIASLSLDVKTFDCEDVGTQTVTLTVTDVNGNESSCTSLVIVEDNIAPTVAVTETITLWPPNHKYHKINVLDFIDLSAISDNCTDVGPTDVYISSVSSDEAENDDDDGNTVDDIVVAPGCQTVDLRAERSGEDGANGRVYTVTLALEDENGNTGYTDLLVLVPVGKNDDVVDDGPYYSVSCGEQNARLSSKVPEASEMTIVDINVYPNPFSSQLSIDYQALSSEQITITVFALTGAKVGTVYRGQVKAGQSYRWKFDAPDHLAEGILILRIKGEEHTVDRKLLFKR